MAIDISSVFEQGNDYLLIIQWDKKNRNLTTILEGSSVTDVVRVLETGDYSSLINLEKYSITISMDMEKINFPSSYNVKLSTCGEFIDRVNDIHSIECDIIDTTPYIPVPLPNFVFTTVSNNLVMEKGKELDTEMVAKIYPPLESQISYYPNTSALEFHFNPNPVFVSSEGTAISNLKIKAIDNASSRSYTIPYCYYIFPK